MLYERGELTKLLIEFLNALRSGTVLVDAITNSFPGPTHLAIVKIALEENGVGWSTRVSKNLVGSYPCFGLLYSTA